MSAMRLRHLVLLVALASALLASTSASATTFRPAATSLPFARISDSTARASKQVPFCPQVNLVCYSPSHLKDVYEFPNGRGGPTGAGQTIVVVEAFGSSVIGASIADDLAQFDAENGLPAPPAFELYTQKTHVSDDGSTDPGSLFQWAVETSLDVEYAHAMAPGANIVLAIADTDDSGNIIQVEKEALAKYPSAIVSQSFGGDETGDFGADEASIQAFEALYRRQVLTGGTIVASSGDYGATNIGVLFGAPVGPMAGFPASSPYVLAVGGTMGNPYPAGLWSNGRYGGEQVWNEISDGLPAGAGASGGAPSVLFDAPPWQLGLTPTSMRAEPDVAYNAANNGGVVVVMGGQHGVVGGTSAGAPQWAAIVALANELRGKQGFLPLGLTTPNLYAIARDAKSYRQDFHDITVGTNAFAAAAGSGLPGFSAGPGYDYPTGLGTPVVSKLLKDLSGRGLLRLKLDFLLHVHGHGLDRGKRARLAPGG
jgi:subtilase family serine protease